MKELMIALMTWASAQTGLPVPKELPSVTFHDRCEIHRFVFDDPTVPCEKVTVVAAYVHEFERMMLPDTWNAGDIYNVSTLLHELVHHMQHQAGVIEGKCRGQIEKTAYDAQIAFLEAAGLDAFKTMNINGLNYMLLTNCAPHF